MYTVAAIIITYNSDLQKINETIQSINKQVTHCIVIDNGNTIFDFKNYKNITLRNLGKNYGIAYAQNRGIEIAKQFNVDFILLSDQDTIYPDNYIEKILIAYQELKNRKLAALTPIFFNTIKKQKNPIMIGKFTSSMDFSKTYIKTAHAIASGTFIVAGSLDEIGGMNEKLFIDYVDYEWCWRANILGYKIFTIPEIIINHHLGDDSKVVFGRHITIRNDIRYYYMIRNGCYLALYSPFLKWYEKILLSKLVIIHTVGVILLKRNINCIRFISKAILDGLLNKLS